MAMMLRVARPTLQVATAALSRGAGKIEAVSNYSTLREIKARVRVIRNIKKITSAMQTIASARLTQALQSLAECRRYGNPSDQVFRATETTAVEGDPKTSLAIICSSDKGFCGDSHSKISRSFYALASEHTENQFDLVVIGEKCKAQLQRAYAKNIQLTLIGVGRNIPIYSDAQAIADQIVMLPTQYANITILYNKFINAQSNRPAVVELCSEEYTEESTVQSPNIFSFDTDEEVLAKLNEFNLANFLYVALVEGHVCELSARRNAMATASKMAGEMIGKHRILYNRTRQAVVTGELIEILTSAAAFEDK